jgi:hypothetical protein
MSRANSSPRPEGPSPVLPPQLHAKKAVTLAVLQFTVVGRSYTVSLTVTLAVQARSQAAGVGSYRRVE